MGEIGILNVGAGDNKLVFDKNDAQGMIRAARIVGDMLKRGYALLVDVGDGKFQRVKQFDPEKCEYIIADFDPLIAQQVDDEEGGEAETAAGETAAAGAEPPRAPRRTRNRRIQASQARAIAVPRTAGG